MMQADRGQKKMPRKPECQVQGWSHHPGNAEEADGEKLWDRSPLLGVYSYLPPAKEAHNGPSIRAMGQRFRVGERVELEKLTREWAQAGLGGPKLGSKTSGTPDHVPGSM